MLDAKVGLNCAELISPDCFIGAVEQHPLHEVPDRCVEQGSTRLRTRPVAAFRLRERRIF
jgi:hypothetical protein